MEEEEKRQEELLMCKMCGYDWLYELDADIKNRKKEYRSIKRNKRCVSCCKDFGVK